MSMSTTKTSGQTKYSATTNDTTELSESELDDFDGMVSAGCRVFGRNILGRLIAEIRRHRSTVG